MKKIIFLITLLVLSCFKVQAETITLTSDRFENVYTYYYDDNLGRDRFLESGKYSFGGNVAYCLEIGQPISTMVYESSSSFDGINISKEILDKIKLISYYGYDYPGHQTDNYYRATQELIWNNLISSEIKWVIDMNPNNFITVETEKNEIRKLLDLHNIKPSFDGQKIEFIRGDEKEITDNNNVLSMYESSDKNVLIEGNKLIIKKEFNNKKITLKKKNYNKKSFLLYASGTSQKMLSVGGVDMPSSTVNIDVIGGSLTLSKFDKENNSDKPQGDATLKGAEYGLYDLDDNLIDKFIIGKKDKIDNIPLGKYYVKEIKPSEGYLLDENIYNVEITKSNLHLSLTVYEEVIKRKVELFKVFASDKTGLLVGEANIKFDIYNKNNELVSSITTDSEGYAYVVLPYGVYTFKQVNSTKDYYKVDDFTVTIDKDDSRSIYKLLSNSEIKARLRVIKKDLDSGEVIINSKARFKIFDVKKKEYVSFVLSYPEEKKIDEFELADDGTFITPDVLGPGDYILYEVDDDLDGYLYNSEGIPFTIGENTNMVNDEAYGPTIELSFYNKRVYGEIEIFKYGENVQYENDNFFYDKVLLEGVVFEVYAKEDIYVNGKLIYKADSLVDEIITDDEGYGILENIPLGKYYIKEVSSSNDNIASDFIYDVDLKYKDQYTKKISVVYNIDNYLRKGDLIINKYNSITHEGLSDTLIEIRNKDDKVVYKGYTDSKGQITVKDLPYGEYYLSEVEAKTGYRILEDKVYFMIDKPINNLDVYNDRIDVPITGIDNKIVNIIALSVVVLGIILIIGFWKKKLINVISGMLILSGVLYYGIYFYKYYRDYYKNEKSVTAFLDNNKEGHSVIDERYNYSLILEIPSIELRRGLLDVNSNYNDVKYNIEIIEEDDSHIILASHNGNGYNSFFKKLNNIELGDVIKLYDKDKVYEYVYSDGYTIEKTGMASIYHDEERKAIILITCSDTDDNAQNVYIGYLKREYSY